MSQPSTPGLRLYRDVDSGWIVTYRDWVIDDLLECSVATAQVMAEESLRKLLVNDLTVLQGWEMSNKFDVGSEVTVCRLRGTHKIEAVKEQYYIRDEGWFDACALTLYVRPLAVGDRVRASSGMKGVIVATHNGEYWVDRGEKYGGCNTYQARELERIPTEAGQ